MLPQSALRQMVYLAIKELSSYAEDVIIVTSSIMKDMQPNLEVIYRPNAIRALCRITDVSTYPTIFIILLRVNSRPWFKPWNGSSKQRLWIAIPPSHLRL
jgi:Adaptin N terminal region